MLLTETDLRYRTCKFGDHIRIGDPANPIIHAGCINDHCHRIVRKMQCEMCGYYDKKY
jgi:hypothetical protein